MRKIKIPFGATSGYLEQFKKMYSKTLHIKHKTISARQI